MTAKNKSKQKIKSREASEKQTPHQKSIHKTKPNVRQLQKEEKSKDIAAPHRQFTAIQKVLAILPLAFLLLIFTAIWAIPAKQLSDPWYKAVQLVDSAKKEKDPEIKKKLLDEGGGQLKDLLEKHPYHPRLHYFAGYYYFINNELDSATTRLKHAIKKGRGGVVNQVEFVAMDLLTNVCISRSAKLINKNKIAEAFKALDDARFYRPENANLNAHLGMLFHRDKQLDSAIFYYQKSLKVNPKNEPVQKNLKIAVMSLAGSKYNEKKFSEAAEYYIKASELTPDDAEVYIRLAASYLNAGRKSKARTAIEKALEIAPKNKQALNLQAQLSRQIPRSQ